MKRMGDEVYDREKLEWTKVERAPYKRFVVFFYDSYYPCGAFEDCAGSFDTLEEAMAFVRSGEVSGEFAEMFDCKEGILWEIEAEDRMKRGE